MSIVKRILTIVLFFVITCSCTAQNSGDNLKSNSNLEGDLEKLLLLYPEVQTLLQQSQLDSAIQLLYSYSDKHENDPSYFNLLGVLYLQQKSYLNAASVFERVVLIDSKNAGAWMDLAIASAEAGSEKTAQIYFDYIENELFPPEKIKRVIASYRKKMEQLKDKNRAWNSQVDLYAGYDTNANSGLLEKRITVTYQGENIELPLDSSYLPRSDNYLNLLANSRYSKKVGEYDFIFTAALNRRSFQQEHSYSHSDLIGGISLSRSILNLDLSISTNGQRFILGGKSLLTNGNFIIAVEKNFKGCRSSISLEKEMRRYLDVRNLNADIMWGQLGTSCFLNIANKTIQAVLIGRAAKDKPSALRAGGTTDKKELLFKLSAVLAHNVGMNVSYQWINSRDRLGYSFLLGNNEKRNLVRRGGKLQLIYPVKNDVGIVFSIEKNVANSNISLFRESSKNINIGIQKKF